MYVQILLFTFLALEFLSTFAIYDPVNVFCGSANCYELLGLDRSATLKDIKKAFRQISLSQHPDKVKDTTNSTDTFKLISKAYTVLSGNETRALFDYYLDHPWDYFKVSGHHIERVAPKTNVVAVILGFLLILSFFLRFVQFQKYNKVVKYLTDATLNNLSLKNGGSKQTIELYKKASELYDDYINECKKKDPKHPKIKMQKDPMFKTIVDKLISEVKIEGGYKKPEWSDLFILQVVLAPLHVYNYSMKIYRRHFSKEPLSREEMEQMAIETVGLGTWRELSAAEQKELIEKKVWTRPQDLIEEDTTSHADPSGGTGEENTGGEDDSLHSNQVKVSKKIRVKKNQ